LQKGCVLSQAAASLAFLSLGLVMVGVGVFAEVLCPTGEKASADRGGGALPIFQFSRGSTAIGEWSKNCSKQPECVLP